MRLDVAAGAERIEIFFFVIFLSSIEGNEDRVSIILKNKVKYLAK
jgi:hypothetical protein